MHLGHSYPTWIVPGSIQVRFRPQLFGNCAGNWALMIVDTGSFGRGTWSRIPEAQTRPPEVEPSGRPDTHRQVSDHLCQSGHTAMDKAGPIVCEDRFAPMMSAVPPQGHRPSAERIGQG